MLTVDKSIKENQTYLVQNEQVLRQLRERKDQEARVKESQDERYKANDQKIVDQMSYRESQDSTIMNIKSKLDLLEPFKAKLGRVLSTSQ
jgi:hypothetical protein